MEVLLELADALEGDPEADVRDFTADATAQLAAVAAEVAAHRGDGAGAQDAATAEEELAEDDGTAEARELHLTS